MSLQAIAGEAVWQKKPQTQIPKSQLNPLVAAQTTAESANTQKGLGHFSQLNPLVELRLYYSQLAQLVELRL
jgi:hypothetical protein